ncbi:hypothetical protein [Xanthomonas hortorum]|uniref:hypothetical protein n=1 Tax=Xanthomonas TaxID=338 RepID=UPI0020CE7B8E|nr:hypothetical protein [Xanthomonas hortorum]UTS72686.1 hypothetical protein NMB96_19945 [Xanthomonas hortorum]
MPHTDVEEKNATAGDQAGVAAESASQKDLKMPSTVSAKLNDKGEISAKISDIAVVVKAQGCNDDSPGIMLCNRSPVVEVTFPGVKEPLNNAPQIRDTTRLMLRSDPCN